MEKLNLYHFKIQMVNSVKLKACNTIHAIENSVIKISKIENPMIKFVKVYKFTSVIKIFIGNCYIFII